MIILEIIPFLEGVTYFERKLFNVIKHAYSVNSDNLQKNKHALEVQEELVKIKIIPNNLKLKHYEELQGGADTTIYEISFHNHLRKYIQRIFRPNESNTIAEYEFSVQKTLFDNNISVPKPYLMKLTPNTRKRPYFVMEKIEGTRLDYLLDGNPKKFTQFIRRLLQELDKIHRIDPRLLTQIHSPDIQKNPFAPIDQILTRRKSLIEKFPKELHELKPVFEWLENNKTSNPCNELVIIHGDYHQSNVIVQDNQDFRILDWSGIAIGDFRTDLGFTSVTISAFSLYEQIFGSKKKLVQMITNTYEQISGRKVENLSYFMILANSFSLLRLYSIINNPGITNENNQSKYFFKSINEYCLYLAELVSETCKTELHQIRDYFE